MRSEKETESMEDVAQQIMDTGHESDRSESPGQSSCGSTNLSEQMSAGSSITEFIFGDVVREEFPDGHFFEGAEKRIVLYLASGNLARFADRSCQKANNSGIVTEREPNLRKIAKASWKTVLNLVNCRILNVISNDHTDAYLLSESSMFVTKNRVMIKTCGRTTLLLCLKTLLKLVADAGFTLIEDVFYSHKNMLYPARQIFPHDSFLKENDYLNKMFDGVVHQFGHNELNRWYLYTLNNQFNSPLKPLSCLNNNEHFKFEMNMEDLDDQVMRLFFRSSYPESVANSEVTRRANIDTIIPDMAIDDYLFTPCGYSMNGLLGENYMTIHITPESNFSYVSIETDVPMESYIAFIQKVVDVFKPGKFMINIVAPSVDAVKLYQRQQRIIQGKEDSDNINRNVYSTPIGTKGKAYSAPGFESMNGCNLYEELSSNSNNLRPSFSQMDLQMMQYKQCDIIFARYVAEGIS